LPVYDPTLSIEAKNGRDMDAKAITAFSFSAPAAVGVITEATHTIAVTVPFVTNVTALQPTIVQTGVSIAPASGAAQDFSKTVNYTVTAGNHTTQVYAVKVTLAPAITSFGFSSPAATGSIDQALHHVTIHVPYGTNVASLTPTIATTGVGVSPASGVSQNFTSPVLYTVTAQDNSTQSYYVYVIVDFRISAAAYGGDIWTSVDWGANWYSGAPAMNWTHLAGSADGTKLEATAGALSTSSGIYRSTDSGATWNLLGAAGSQAFSGLASSDSGAILGANVYDGTGNFYYSNSSGTSWNTTTISGGLWWGEAHCAGNGLYWIGCNVGDTSSNVSIWTGTFDGTSVWNWTRSPKGYTSEGSQNPSGYAIAKIGGPPMLFVTFGTTAYLSPDFGVTWNPLPALPGTPLTASAMSGNGNKLAVVVNDAALYTSANGGATWNSALGLPGSGYLIRKPVISYDGSRMAVLAFSGANSYIFISYDGGASFAVQTGPGASGQADWGDGDIYIQSQ
jgi:hypothetical protein